MNQVQGEAQHYKLYSKLFRKISFNEGENYNPVKYGKMT